MAGSGAEVVIVGGGLAGVSAAWALTERGVQDVLVLERGTVGGGMTGKSSGIIRGHYGVSSLAAMAAASLPVFENAAELFGDDIGYRGIGYVVGVGEPNVEHFRLSVAAQRRVGVETREVDASDVAALWPSADLSPFAAFAWERRGGYGDAYRTAQAFAAAARRGGAIIKQGTAAAGLCVAGDRVTGVRLGDGTTVAAGTVVVALGVWTRPFLAAHRVDVPIEVHREQIVLVKPGVDVRGAPVFSDLVSLQYVRPESGGEILFGNSDLSRLEVVDPDRYSNRADRDFLELAAERMGTRFPALADAVVSSSYAGCYDVTPDWNPIISATPLAGLIVAAGFSGHGFKISPAIGRLVADLVVNGRSGDARIPATDFRLARFAEGTLLRSPYPYVGAGEMR